MTGKSHRQVEDAMLRHLVSLLFKANTIFDPLPVLFEPVGVMNVELETVFDTDLLRAAPTDQLHGHVALYREFNFSSVWVLDSAEVDRKQVIPRLSAFHHKASHYVT